MRLKYTLIAFVNIVPMSAGPITSAHQTDFEIEYDTNYNFFIITDKGSVSAARSGIKGDQVHVFPVNVKAARPQDPLMESQSYSPAPEPSQKVITKFNKK